MAECSSFFHITGKINQQFNVFTIPENHISRPLESAKGTRDRLHSRRFKSPWEALNASCPRNANPRPRYRISLHFPGSRERSVWKQHSRNGKFAIPSLGARARKRHETTKTHIFFAFRKHPKSRPKTPSVKTGMTSASTYVPCHAQRGLSVCERQNPKEKTV